MKKFLLPLLTMIIIAGYVTAVQAAPSTFDVRVNSAESSVNFRTGPSSSSMIITEIPNGQVLTIYDLSYNSQDDLFFGSTVYNSSEGWISLRQTVFLTEVPVFYVEVSSSGGSINFRSDASTGSNVITEIPDGVRLKISDMRYNSGDDLFFGMTEYSGYQGWVSLRQTFPITRNEYEQGISAGPSGPRPVDSNAADDRVGYNGTVQVSGLEGSINFRTEPSTASSIITEIPNRTVLTIEDVVTNEELYWGFTEYNGLKGWVSLRQTSTPFHTYNMPEHVREWDGGTVSGTAYADEAANQTIVGNWEYNSFDETPNAYYHAGYCFYEDGTGLDTFWNQTFTYTTEGDIVTISFDDPEYGTEHFVYSFREAFGNSQNAQYGIRLEYLPEDEEGNLLRETRQGSDGNGWRKLHYADLSEAGKAAASIKEGICKSWDNRWYLSTQDGVTVTIDSSDIHYNSGREGQQIIPERINGHRVTKIADEAFHHDFHESLVIEEGIQSIGNQAFRMCSYKTAAFPVSVQYIGSDVFTDCSQLEVIYAPENSYAAEYFQAAGMNVEYME